MLAEYGLLASEYTQHEVAELTMAWVRRQRFAARLIAIEVGQLFGGGKKGSQRKGRSDGTMTADEAWAILERGG